MPTVNNAIQGVPSVQRKREALANHADFSAVPTWLKTWNADQVDQYVIDNVTDLASAKIAIRHMAKAIIILRDVLKLYHEEG